MSEFTHRLPHQPWSKPSRNEDQYFQQQEFRKRMEAARRREAQRELEERKRWLDEHKGHCPRCGGAMEPLSTEEGNTEQCSNCLGVWMDHETFDRLTHPEDKNEYLTGILRGLFLEWTTGQVKPETHGGTPRD